MHGNEAEVLTNFWQLRSGRQIKSAEHAEGAPVKSGFIAGAALPELPRPG